MIDTNLSGVFHTVQPAIRHLIAGGRGGAIVITCSSVALRSLQNLAHYGSAKSGQIGLSRTLALELAPHHIRVNTLHPTNVDTAMSQNDAIRHLFLPNEEQPTREQSEPVTPRSTHCRSRGSNRRTSPRRCSSSLRTTLATSPGLRCRSTPASP